MKISWSDFDKYTDQLLSNIKESGYTPDMIVAVGISGFIPATIVAKGLGINSIQTIIIRSYDTKNNKQSPRVISDTFSDSIKNKKVLVVDDIVATGETFDLIKERLNSFKPAEIRLASTVVSEYICNKYPDYWGQSIMREPSDFITFPWDK